MPNIELNAHKYGTQDMDKVKQFATECILAAIMTSVRMPETDIAASETQDQIHTIMDEDITGTDTMEEIEALA